MEKHIAVYLRVSSKSQDTRSQELGWMAGTKAPAAG